MKPIADLLHALRFCAILVNSYSWDVMSGPGCYPKIASPAIDRATHALQRPGMASSATVPRACLAIGEGSLTCVCSAARSDHQHQRHVSAGGAAAAPQSLRPCAVGRLHAGWVAFVTFLHASVIGSAGVSGWSANAKHLMCLPIRVLPIHFTPQLTFSQTWTASSSWSTLAWSWTCPLSVSALSPFLALICHNTMACRRIQCCKGHPQALHVCLGACVQVMRTCTLAL